ncbi:Intraflagellar transport protein 27-like protein [Armadillidium vulgare]|nr:Intraflagellar transport protein 27-like protein [Armadillidium vulgare]
MSGKEFHKSLMKKMSEQTSLVLLVYDVTSEESFVMAENLYQEVQKINGEIPVKGILFGNKTDLVNRRRVTPKTGNELAKKLGLTYFEGSGKEQQGIDTPLFFLANEWYKIYTERTNILKEFT